MNVVILLYIDIYYIINNNVIICRAHRSNRRAAEEVHAGSDRKVSEYSLYSFHSRAFWGKYFIITRTNETVGGLRTSGLMLEDRTSLCEENRD